MNKMLNVYTCKALFHTLLFTGGLVGGQDYQQGEEGRGDSEFWHLDKTCHLS